MARDAAGDTLHVDVRARAGLDVKLVIPPGFTVLLGPSGAGKTTTLLTIAGLVTPREGTIRLGDVAFFDGTERVVAEQRRVGLVFQSLALFPHLSALDNVAYGVRSAAGARARRAVAASWLERLRVAHVANRRPATFSGGEGQRVALARALASEPRVLLLDEPFSALDDALRAPLRDDLKTLVADASIPVVFVTHDERDARALAQQVVVLVAGRVARADSAARFFAGG